MSEALDVITHPHTRVTVTVTSWVSAHVDGAHITICFHYLHSYIVQFVLSMLSPTTIFISFFLTHTLSNLRSKKRKIWLWCGCAGETTLLSFHTTRKILIPNLANQELSSNRLQNLIASTDKDEFQIHVLEVLYC